MSHFSVLVCVPADIELRKLDDFLAERMERWNENREVAEYRDYEEGSPDEHWWARALRRKAEKHGIATYESELADARRQKLERPYEQWTPEDRAADEMRDFGEAAAWVGKFGPGPWTWAQVAEAYNARWHPGNEVALADDDSDSERLRIDDEGRAYTISTSNPEAKWDYWRIGGRWREYFVAREPGAGIILARKDWDSGEEKNDGRIWCDGGPVGLLDFDAMRDARVALRLPAYDRWVEIVAEHGQPPAWADLIGLVELKELSIEEARLRYNTHPAIRAAQQADISGWGECPEVMYGTSREEFERLARLEAVPGYALVTLDGEWVAPGRMGWFGMSSDGPGEREGYNIAVNKYLESLRPETVLVVLDCHI